METHCHKNPCISCTVMTCIYNKDASCTADHVYSGTEYASDVADTVCASYRSFNGD